MILVMFALSLVLAFSATAVGGADRHQVGVYADADRTQTCITGQAGDRFHARVFARAAADLGLVYVTLRFDFPENLDRRGRPALHPAVTELIVTDYADGTVEWNLVFDDSCPTGWVEVFSQECVLLDEEPSRIGIEARYSLIRDCEFVLDGVVVENQLAINAPGCESVAIRPASWSATKAGFRR